MHRSGTSAVTRVINLLGADISSDLIPARPDNARGYWESAEIVAIHNHLLRALGSSSDEPLPLPAGWLETSAAQDGKRRLAQLLIRDFADSPACVVKDPRIARLLPLWLDLLDDIDKRPVVIIAFRNPLEVAASLAQRDRLSPSKSLLLYINSYLAAELASRGRPRCFVCYNRLLSDWRPFVDRFMQLMGDGWPAVDRARAAEIDDFLTPDLYHHRFGRDDLAACTNIPATAIEMFDRMDEAADTGNERALRTSFDRLGETAAEADRMFRAISAERAMLRRELAQVATSASWRLTAPLRRMKHWIRRFELAGD
jgi:hypothetical protein